MLDLASFLDVLSAGSAYMLVLVPLGVVLLLGILFIPSMLTAGAKARSVAKALYCYLMQGVGIILMSIGVLPTLYSVFGGVGFSGNSYLSLLVVFGAGGAFYLWHEQMAHTLDLPSRAVPAAIYSTSLLIIGKMLALVSVLSLALSFLLREGGAEGWWVHAVTMLLYGLALEWLSHASTPDNGFQSMPVNAPAAKGPTFLRPAKAIAAPSNIKTVPFVKQAPKGPAKKKRK